MNPKIPTGLDEVKDKPKTKKKGVKATAGKKKFHPAVDRRISQGKARAKYLLKRRQAGKPTNKQKRKDSRLNKVVNVDTSM